MIFHTTAAKLLMLITGKATEVTSTGLCYLGLLTEAPAADGSNLNEISTTDYPSYSRILLNAYSAESLVSVWSSIVGGVVSNAKAFSGDSQCLEESGWPECTHWCLFSSKTGGTPMVADVFRDPDGEIDATTGLYPVTTLTVEYKKVPVFRKGALQLTLQ